MSDSFASNKTEGGRSIERNTCPVLILRLVSSALSLYIVNHDGERSKYVHETATRDTVVGWPARMYCILNSKINLPLLFFRTSKVG